MGRVQTGGQRKDLGGRSGEKRRAPTRPAHTGSRVDASHGVDKARKDRETKGLSRAKRAVRGGAKKRS